MNYDLLWPQFLKIEHNETTAARMAYLRLRYPLDLTDQCAGAYRQYLTENAELVLRLLLEDRDTAGVSFLLRETQPGKEAFSAACALARSLQAPEALAVLLEEQHRRFPEGRRGRFVL